MNTCELVLCVNYYNNQCNIKKCTNQRKIICDCLVNIAEMSLKMIELKISIDKLKHVKSDIVDVLGKLNHNG